MSIGGFKSGIITIVVLMIYHVINSPFKDCATPFEKERSKKASQKYPPPSSPKRKTPLDWEHQARAEQEAFCRAFRQEQQQQASSSVLNMAETTVRDLDSTRYDQEYGRPFSMAAYKNKDIVSDHIIRFGGWEGGKTKKMVQKMLESARQKGKKPSELAFIDIGANVGWFTMVMASLGFKVYAVEPMPANQNLIRQSLCLRQNQAFSSNVVLHARGVSKHPQQCVLWSDNNNVGDGILTCDTNATVIENFVPRRGSAIRARVEVVTLDELIDTTVTEIIAVKMDAEGHEGFVLEGGKRVLLDAHIPYITSEFEPAWVRDRGADPRAFLSDFMNAGYSIKRENGAVVTLEERTWKGSGDLDLEYVGGGGPSTTTATA